MDLEIILIYCLCDDVLTLLHINDDPQCQMSSAEVMTTGIVAALFYGGNIQLSRKFLKLCGYIPKILSHSRLHRRLLRISKETWEAVFAILKCLLTTLFPTREFAIDSCPLPVCQPCRSWRSKLYHGKQYLGYCASKKLHYFGLKIHLIVSEHGVIIEFLLTPASYADISALKCMPIDLPEGSVLYGDRAYNSSAFEEELEEMAHIFLVPQRKRKAKKQHSGPIQFLQKYRRKVIETTFSQIARLMPSSL
jgi:IS5 family transposase